VCLPVAKKSKNKLKSKNKSKTSFFVPCHALMIEIIFSLVLDKYARIKATLQVKTK
jgi:hypothetical protein